MAGSADALVREIKIEAKPETIFPFLTDPQKMIRWKGAKADLDARPGGIYRVEINSRVIARGEYVEIVPNRKVVLTWGWEGEESSVPPGSSRVEIELIPDGNHTLVRLTHTELPSAEAAAEHSKGWDHYLARLAVAASGGDPGPDPMERNA